MGGFLAKKLNKKSIPVVYGISNPKQLKMMPKFAKKGAKKNSSYKLKQQNPVAKLTGTEMSAMPPATAGALDWHEPLANVLAQTSYG